MRKSNFGLKIVGGKELSTGVISLSHKQKFAIRLCNYSHELKCNAELRVNGKLIGKYRVETYRCILIERPPNDNGIFTFFKHGSDEAERIGLTGKPADGIIDVRFVPEIADSFNPMELNYLDLRITGGVGLSGQSKQEFSDADPITEDIGETIVIKTKLVCDDEPRSL